MIVWETAARTPRQLCFKIGLRSDAGAFISQPFQPNWVSDLIYSSGTTGIPKGIAQSYEGRAKQWIDLGGFGIDAGARVLQTVSLSSNFGLSALFGSLVVGRMLIHDEQISGEQAVEVLKREEISVAFLPPATLIRTMEAPGFEAGVKAGNA